MNIIFDLGGVVFDWNPSNLIDRVTDNQITKDLLLKHLLKHSDWVDLDQGIVTTKKVIENTKNRSGIDITIIENLFKNIPKELIPKQKTLNLLREIYNTEHHLYVLSNMHPDSAKSLTENYSFWNYFRGIVFSCDIKMIKPNKNIFNYIISKYDLEIENTIFIDDTKENISTAKELGLKTILFDNPDQLRSELTKLKII